MFKRLAFIPVLFLVGCSAEQVPEPATEPATEPVVKEIQAEDGECPYLDSQAVAQINGQKVLRVGVDKQFEVPACQFWSYWEEPQLTVIVREMASEGGARAVVDHYAPVAETSPAEEPTGWNGGRGSVEGGAVYAVSKGATAVVVLTDQEQSVKAQLVAEEVIGNLGL